MNYDLPGFELKKLSFDHKQQMMKLHDDVLAALPNPSWYFPSDEWEFDAWLTGQEAWGYLDGDVLCGFAVITPWHHRFGRSYAQVLGEEAENTFDFHDVLVLPRYRGRGMHTMFLKLFTDLAREAGAMAIYATVDPENSASWHNFEKAGYEIASVRLAYDGRQRRYYKLTLG